MADQAGTAPKEATTQAGADVAGLARTLGHAFRDLGMLEDAVTHPSLMGLQKVGRDGRRPQQGPGLAYERLEFLGDRVLGLVMAEWLLERYPDEREGALAKRHASLVQREALGRVADAIGLGAYLRMTTGEAQGGGRANRTILGDACEAVIGALYLDGGMEVARGFIRKAWTEQMERPQAPPLDPKTALQEWAQGKGKPLPTYELLERSGPAHESQFRVAVRIAGLDPVEGIGTSKRTAEKMAASEMLSRVGVKVDG